ncbi:MAG: hypothetical protein GC179_16020 [Anaerolineaceae bacterium]|nr:hypothetical protein [Anaerolineaceae bacterium]
MLKIKLITIAAALALGLGLLAVSAKNAAPAVAAQLDESTPNHFSELISRATADGKAITFDFVVPLVTGERVWTLPDANAKRDISNVGTDYVCFSEPWNEGKRERCTPFSNITSITFLK